MTTTTQDIIHTIEEVEKHQTTKWMKKFVPIYLFHFLLTLPT